MLELHAHLKTLWTVWFFGLFVFIVVRTLLPARRAELEAQAKIPLTGDTEPSR